jgi:hypothetical protein
VISGAGVRGGIAIALAVTLATAAAAGAAATTVGRPDARGVPPEVRHHADDWPVAGQDYGNARAAASSIDSSNVTRLEDPR